MKDKTYLAEDDEDNRWIIKAPSLAHAKKKFLKIWNKGMPKSEWDTPWDIVDIKEAEVY